jgi:valyl-tRNA synthetase
MNYLDAMTTRIEEQYNEYDFHNPALSLRQFLWEEFASHYVELVKARAYNENEQFTEKESESAKYTLHVMIERLITLLHPIIPQVTSIIATDLKHSLEEFPQPKKTKSSPELIKQLTDFNSHVWKTKREKNISLREPISNISIPKELKAFESDLAACHSLQ